MSKKILPTLLELEKSIAAIDSVVEARDCLNRFQLIEIDILNEYGPKLYLQMWKVAFDLGKLKFAKNYAEKALSYLISYKRIPQIKTFILSLQTAGLFKNKFEMYFNQLDILLGKRNNQNAFEVEYMDQYLNHPEYWKQSPGFLKQYLLLADEWDQDYWRLCYEFVLLHYWDQEIFEILLNKSHEIKNEEFEKKFQSLFKSRKLKMRNLKAIKMKDEISEDAEVSKKLNFDYDQVAMDLLSGSIEPSFEEQRRVINSLKFITEEELFSKGQEMIVAFELLGMEQVVLVLCERMLKNLSDVKQRARTYYVWVQALFNLAEYHKVIDLIDDILLVEPVYGDERLAFLYIKAEACFKLNKTKLAKEIYATIHKQKPNYRLLGERLRSLEKT